MSKTRNNMNTALMANQTVNGPREKTNNLVTIAVTALASHKSELTINQYNVAAGGAAILTNTFTMVGGTSYNFGQVVVLPFFNVSITNLTNQNQTFTTVNTILKLSNADNSTLQFVNTQTEHMTKQGGRGNVYQGTLLVGAASTAFNCNTYGNNCIITYQDGSEGADEVVHVEGSAVAEGNTDWVVIGAFTSYVSDANNRYSFASIRLGAFERVRIVNTGGEKTNIVCSIYSS